MKSPDRVTSQPVLPDVGVIALVPDHWGTRWQPRHHVISRLSHFFHTVWVEPALGWRKLISTATARKSRRNQMHSPPDFSVYRSESWPPCFYRPHWLARLSFAHRMQRARDVLKARGCERIILYIWRPEFAPAVGAIPHDLSCYHIDDEYSFSSVDLPTPHIELDLIRSADQVFVHSRELLEKKGSINPHTELVPNGVDYHAYSTQVREPSDLASIPHPRIGFTGYLKKQLDWPLLLRLATRHAEWSFVFVGPQLAHAEIRPFIEQLSLCHNVHFLGPKTARDLAAYPQHFDVCIMPYQIDGYTRYIYPLKLHEYLASGRPTVGARIPALADYSDVVVRPRTETEWSAAIADALLPEANRDERRLARQSVARQHDWTSLVQRIAQTMVGRMGPAYRDRFAASLPAPHAATQCSSLALITAAEARA